MYFKRPSFKRGGPTGIAQMTPSRQRYAGGGNIGGGGIGGRNLGTRTGFNVILNEFGMPYQKPPTPYKPNFNLKGSPYTPKNYPLTVINKIPKPLGAMASTAGGIAALAPVGATVLGLAQMNKAKTLEGLNFMKSMNNSGVFDETAMPGEFEQYGEDLKKIDKEGKTKIGLIDNFFMDEKGRYPKMFGRTEDRDLRAAEEKEIENLRAAETDLEDGITNYENDEAEAAEQKSALDSALDTMIKDTDKDKPKDKGGDKPEPTFEDTYQTEFDRIQKLIGDDSTKGMAAIALSEAIGTPGTLADKAAVLNKSLVALMGNKKKDKKEIAMLAYKATKEIEKAKIVAGKQTDSAKNFEELKTLNRIIQDDTGTYNEDQKKNARSKLKVITAAIDSLNPAKAQKTMDPGKARETLKTFEKVAKKLSDMDKTSPEYAAALNSYMAQIELLNNYSELMPSIRRLDSVYVGALGKKDGGRIGFANGSPIEQITETETVETSGTPTVQVTQLSFEELRDRLPPEVTDDVIRFLSQSEQALQDFAYIRTAGDIKKFNMKYGLNLVLPAQA